MRRTRLNSTRQHCQVTFGLIRKWDQWIREAVISHKSARKRNRAILACFIWCQVPITRLRRPTGRPLERHTLSNKSKSSPITARSINSVQTRALRRKACENPPCSSCRLTTRTLRAARRLGSKISYIDAWLTSNYRQDSTRASNPSSSRSSRSRSPSSSSQSSTIAT